MLWWVDDLMKGSKQRPLSSLVVSWVVVAVVAIVCFLVVTPEECEGWTPLQCVVTVGSSASPKEITFPDLSTTNFIAQFDCR